jgi:hypothetical protein
LQYQVITASRVGSLVVVVTSNDCTSIYRLEPGVSWSQFGYERTNVTIQHVFIDIKLDKLFCHNASSIPVRR